MITVPRITFFIRGSRAQKMTIYCTICHYSQKHRFSTGLAISANLWDKKRGSCKVNNSPTGVKVNAQLEHLKNSILETYLNNQANDTYLNPKQLYNEVKRANTSRTKPITTISEVIQIRLREVTKMVKLGRLKPNTLKDFKAFQGYWNRFIQDCYENEPPLESLDKEFVMRYIEYSVDIGDKPSTTNDKRLKWLKTAWKYAFDNKLTSNREFGLTKRQTYEVLRPVISSDELFFLHTLFSKGKSSIIIDLILLGCYTGLRYGDLSKNVNWEHAKYNSGGQPKLRVKTEKTGKVVNLLVSTKATEILKKYNYKPPFPTNSQVFSRQAKAELEKCEIFCRIKTDFVTGTEYILSKVFSAHCMRRTFISLLIKNRMPLNQIRQYSGHTFVSTVELYAQSFTDDMDNDLKYFERL